jgi:hypothetical protein
MQKFKNKFFLVLVGLMISSNSNAAENSRIAITNIDSLFLKHFACSASKAFLSFNISNQSNSRVVGELIITAFDADNDPINNLAITIDVGPVSGEAVQVQTNCNHAVSYAGRITDFE